MAEQTATSRHSSHHHAHTSRTRAGTTGEAGGLGLPVFAFDLPLAAGGPSLRPRFLVPRPSLWPDGAREAAARNGGGAAKLQLPPSPHRQAVPQEACPNVVGFFHPDGTCDLHPIKAEGAQAVRVEGLPLWVDILSVPVVADPAVAVQAPLIDEGSEKQTTASSSAQTITPSSARRSSARSGVVISLHPNDAHHGGPEVRVRAMELRQTMSRSSSNGQTQHSEWRPIEVEIEVPLHLEKTLDHWRKAAYSVVPAPAVHSTSAGVESSSPSSVHVLHENSSGSPSSSYLSAAKGKKDSEEDDDSLSTGRQTGGLIPLPHASAAHIASDGEWLALAVAGVTDICMWRMALHTVTLGKTRRRQLRLSFERLLSYPGLEVTSLALMPDLVIAGTAHGHVVVHQLDKSGTNNAWSVISPEHGSTPVDKTSITAIYPVERRPERSSFLVLDSLGSLYFVALGPAPDDGTSIESARMIRLSVPFKLHKHLLAVLPPQENLELGALVFGISSSVYSCTIKCILDEANQRAQSVPSSDPKLWEKPLHVPLSRAILCEGPVDSLAAFAPLREKEVGILDTVYLFILSVTGTKLYLI